MMFPQSSHGDVSEDGHLAGLLVDFGYGDVRAEGDRRSSVAPRSALLRARDRLRPGASKHDKLRPRCLRPTRICRSCCRRTRPPAEGDVIGFEEHLAEPAHLRFDFLEREIERGSADSRRAAAERADAVLDDAGIAVEVRRHSRWVRRVRPP